MDTIDFVKLAPILLPNLKGDYSFTPDNVYQEGSAVNREIIGRIVDQIIQPGSRIENYASINELSRRSKAGESCLILAEHYSNFDFPALYHLVEKNPHIAEGTAECLLPIRGMKLSEESMLTAPFTRSYDTIIIYPSRSLDGIKDPQKLADTRRISVPINHAAMREMIDRKHNGRIITVFPAGTRYRPWAPDSRRGVREIHSYMKTFDNVVFMAINGNALIPSRSDDMTQDRLKSDLLILTCSDIISGRHFRRETEAAAPEGTDPKQYVVDRVMEELLILHNRVEPGRLEEKASIEPAPHPDN